jgi:hypothetical protein
MTFLVKLQHQIELLVFLCQRYLKFVDDAQDMISSEVPDAIQVKSFNLESTNIYTISLSQDENTMIACSCPSFAQSATKCKHMFLVNQIDQILLPDTTH